jgi:hypothetical protein
MLISRETGLESMFVSNHRDHVPWHEVSRAVSWKGNPSSIQWHNKTPVVEEGTRGINIQIPERDRQQALTQP